MEREAIHVFYYEHPKELSWPLDVAAVAERSPGELVSSEIKLTSGGNEVRSYLDVVAARDVSTEILTARLATFAGGANAAGHPWISGPLAVRFYAGPSIIDPVQEFESLRTSICELHARGRQRDPLVVHVVNREHSIRYSLDEKSQARIRTLRGPDWVMSPAVVIDRDTLDDLQVAHGNLEDELVPVLTGLERAEVAAIGGIRFVTQSGSFRAIPIEAPSLSPGFPTVEVLSSLNSSTAARRLRGFAQAEEALSSGETVPAEVLSRVEAIALEGNAPRDERWRAIDFLRLSVLRDEVRSALVREWILEPESSIGSMAYDSGPFPLLMREWPRSLDEAISAIGNTPLATLNKFVIRDVLVGVRAELLTRVEQVDDARAIRWKEFADRCIRDRSRSEMAPNDPLLVEAIQRLVGEAPGTDDHAEALWAYNQLRLKNPSAEVLGLWHKAGTYVAVAPATAKSHDGRKLTEWFQRHRPLGTNVELRDAVPVGWNSVPEQSVEEFIQPVSSLKNISAAYSDLCLSVPRDFPEFRLVRDPLRVVTTRALTDDERLLLERKWRQLHLPKPCNTEVTELPQAAPRRRAQGDIALVPGRRLPAAVGRALRELVEADDDLWMRRRSELYSGAADLTPEALLPLEWRAPKTRCIVPTSVFRATSNIRNYLSIFEEVVLVAPLASAMEEVLASLRCSSKQLLELMLQRRVRLLLPQAVDRYDVPFLSNAAEAAPDALLLSRCLGTATVVAARQRIPLLYPVLPPAGRADLLRALASLAESVSEEAGRIIRALANELGRIYADAEQWLHQQGALVSMHAGVGSLTAAIWRAIRGQDLLIEFGAAAPTVEWGDLLRATIYPVEVPGYSEARAAELVTRVYGGRAGLDFPPLKTFADKILTIDNDAPLEDLIKAFDNDATRKLRTFILGLYGSDAPITGASAVEEFNRSVRGYESNREKTRAWELAGIHRVRTDAHEEAKNAISLLQQASASQQWIKTMLARPSRDETILLSRRAHAEVVSRV